MTKQEKIIEDIKLDFEKDEDCHALLVTGSVARGEATESSDIDLIQIAHTDVAFIEKKINGIVVEVKTHTREVYLEEMRSKPMNVYQWLDAKLIFDKENVSQELIEEARKIFETYKADPKEKQAVKKWLRSTKIKINEAMKSNNLSLIGFNVSNILWKMVEGLYIVNDQPTPPSTTAYRRIKTLDVLPDDFLSIWEGVLVGDLRERTTSTLVLIDFVVSEIIS